MKHALFEVVFLVDGFVYQTTLNRLGFRGRRDYTDQNLIEKWFQILKMRIDRLHNSWVGSPSTIRRWCLQSTHYYLPQRPDQSLDDRPLAEEFTKFIVSKDPNSTQVDSPSLGKTEYPNHKIAIFQPQRKGSGLDGVRRNPYSFIYYTRTREH